MLFHVISHAFGQRYELPIPLSLFVLSGGGVVLLSFLLVVNRHGGKSKNGGIPESQAQLNRTNGIAGICSLVLLAALILTGLVGSQVVSENILPTLFWLIVWIAVPLSCSIVGDWTKKVNPFAVISRLADNSKVRELVLLRRQPLQWPRWLGWWPAAALYFLIACGELVFNQTATQPAVTAAGLLTYALVCAFMGLLFGAPWRQKGEVFSVLFDTWGRLGYWRFGALGRKGFTGGLDAAFEPVSSRIVFVVLLLVSVGFDGLLATPAWSHFQHQLPATFLPGTAAYLLLATAIFVSLAAALWALFSIFAALVGTAGRHTDPVQVSLAALLPSLLPISFGYLLAHNIEYLLVNGQLLFPLIGNPVGKVSWPVHLPYPFNDSFEPRIHLLPSAFYWYFSVAVIVLVHIVAVVLVHRHLSGAAKVRVLARRSEYPWIIAMVAYTMLSLWLLAQPLVKEKQAALAVPVTPAPSVVSIGRDKG